MSVRSVDAILLASRKESSIVIAKGLKCQTSGRWTFKRVALAFAIDYVGCKVVCFDTSAYNEGRFMGGIDSYIFWIIGDAVGQTTAQ